MPELEQILWSPASTAPPLEPGSLHLWIIRCGPGEADPRNLRHLLSPHERDRADRFYLDRHRERYVRSHAGLRSILSLYRGMSPRGIDLIYGPAGKPALAGGPEFNMTTSADLALLAVRADRPVGIDCERLRPRSQLLAIAGRMFDAETAQQVEMASDAQRLEVFARAWTALEARVKADGRGLFQAQNPSPMPDLGIRHFIPEPGYIAAIACPDLPPRTQWTAMRLTGFSP